MSNSAFDCPRDHNVESLTIEGGGCAEYVTMTPDAQLKLRTEADSQFFLQMAQFWGLRHAANLAQAFEWKVDYRTIAIRLRRQADEIDALADTLDQG